MWKLGVLVKKKGKKNPQTIKQQLIRIRPTNVVYDCINMAATGEMDFLAPHCELFHPVPATDTYYTITFSKKSNYSFSQSPLNLHFHLVLL